jgi:hypothetical protein
MHTPHNKEKLAVLHLKPWSRGMNLFHGLETPDFVMAAVVISIWNMSQYNFHIQRVLRNVILLQKHIPLIQIFIIVV